MSSTTSTGPQAVPGQLLLPFSRAGISNILCSPSTSPHLLSAVSAKDNVVYITVKIKKPFQRPTSSFSIIHTNLPGSRLLLPFLHNPKPNLTLNFGLHSVHLPRDSEASSPSLHLSFSLSTAHFYHHLIKLKPPSSLNVTPHLLITLQVNSASFPSIGNFLKELPNSSP